MVAALFSTTSSAMDASPFADVLEDAGPLLVEPHVVAKREVEGLLDRAAAVGVEHLAVPRDFVPGDRARGS